VARFAVVVLRLLELVRLLVLVRLVLLRRGRPGMALPRSPAP
jgi:hypothetical protein